jgi:uncharacterized protein (DUF58 family)
MKGPFPYLLLLFLLAAFLHAEFLLYVVYAMLIVVVLTRWWARRALGAIVAVRRYERHALLGDTIAVELELRNAGRLPIVWVEVRESLPVDLAPAVRVAHALALAPRRRRTLRYELLGRKRGLYRLGPLRLSNGDLLGQQEYQREITGDDVLTVYPRIVPLQRLGLPSLSPFGHLRSRERLYADPARTGGVRDYSPGDNVRDIHWSASAAAGSLQVKVYEPAMSLPTALLLDLTLGGYDRAQGMIATELGVVVAASLAVALGNARQEIALYTNGQDPLAAEAGISGFAMGKGQAHLVRILELLARVQAVPEAPFDALLATARTHLPWGATLVAIGPDGDAAYHAALMALRHAGFSVVRIVLGRRSGAPSHGLPVYYVASIDDVDALNA